MSTDGAGELAVGEKWSSEPESEELRFKILLC